VDVPWIVFGLGNPGADYAATRHNIGFRAVERLAERHGGCWSLAVELEREAWIASVELDGRPLVVVKPRTFMNRVGRAAVKACRRFEVGPERFVAVCDDADLELGRVRVRPGGGAGGHNGLRSLIDALGTEAFPRVKLGIRGIAREAAELADYVLQPFDADERALAEALAGIGADAVESVVTLGVTAAMDRHNARRGGERAEPGPA
jgi:PTH1 family peptidyl-tRNA hydrolase